MQKMNKEINKKINKTKINKSEIVHLSTIHSPLPTTRE